MNEKETKRLFILDVINVVTSILGVFIFTVLFGIIKDNFKYVLVISIMYAIYNFITSFNSATKYLQEKKKLHHKTSSCLTIEKNTSIL